MFVKLFEITGEEGCLRSANTIMLQKEHSCEQQLVSYLPGMIGVTL